MSDQELVEQDMLVPLEKDLSLVLDMTGLRCIVEDQESLDTIVEATRQASIDESLPVPRDVVLRRELLRSIATLRFEKIQTRLTSSPDENCQDLKDRIISCLTQTEAPEENDSFTDYSSLDPARWSLRDAIQNTSTAYLATGLLIALMEAQDQAIREPRIPVSVSQ